ncbi:duf292 domain-containing protein [Moniliophthora roreri MCA 2997]|uniref:Duf292 domain-containing protein n=1 Tax=Moniliophthora roreri (strain MCA 2997) TaxID=1381753 RepID=V2XVH7_MONRO|nr:duf292 domain-containing protein [Moniliophthora roreri MCA 2997]
MAGAWDAASVKALLRTTSQRLGHLQDKNDAKANNTRREIATLLQGGNLGAARTKAQDLMHKDAMGDVLEMLEMHIGMLLERFSEIGQSNPAVIEAASTIIYAAPHVDCTELHSVRDFLVQTLGADFARSAEYNRKNHVSGRVTRALGNMPTTVGQLDDYLVKIAKSHRVDWVPEPQRQERLNVLSEMLHPNTSPMVDIAILRKLCSRGIPDKLSWLRPRIWKLFFGILPALKASWQREMHQQRANYYDLLRRLIEPFKRLPAPTDIPHPLDNTLLRVSKQLSSIPSNLFSGLQNQSPSNPDCPFDNAAAEGIRIDCASSLNDRLKTLRKRNDSISESSSIPEIRLEAIESEKSTRKHSRSESEASTLLSGKSLISGQVHEKHESALLRILYLHSSINPGNLSPHVPVLLAPLYSVLNQETDPQEMAHVEADTFWLFEALIAEFSELEDEEGGNVWIKKFGERLAWADNDLWHSLNARGLDPAQPHYSYRWLAPLLTYTLPYPSIIIAWDAIFACQPRQRDSNAKLDLLLDICTSMLIRARVALIRLGKSHYKAPSSWGDEGDMRPPSPLRPWELGDAFTEGLTLLKHYPIESAGGIDRVLQVAADLRQRREDESKATAENTPGLGARLKATMWKGFTNTSSDSSPSSVSSDDEEDEKNIDDGNETETVMLSSGLTSRLATTVWRGITNQSSMEPPPTPITPTSPAVLGTPPRSSHFVDAGAQSPRSPTAQSPSLLWGYAEKLKESDAAATLAKVSSNWRAKALVSTWGIRRDDSPAMQKDPSSPSLGEPSPVPGFRPGEVRRGSLPDIDGEETYSPPPRPKHFRPPRDTIILSSLNILKSPTPSSPELSPQSDSAFLQKTSRLQASLAALSRSEASKPPPKPKTGPRPLLLNSSSLMTTNGRDRPISRSENSTPIPDRPSNQWNHITNFRRHIPHRDSQSSISSLSPSDAITRAGKTEWDSDGSVSRRIPLNRRSISPMAPHARTLSTAHSTSSISDRGLLSPATSASHLAGPASAGWGQIDLPDSPPITTPPTTTLSIPNATVKINDDEEPVEDTIESPDMPHSQTRKPPRKNTPPFVPELTTSESSAVETPSRSPRIRSKRHPSRPSNLRLQDPSRPRVIATDSPTTLGNALAVEWPDQDSSVTPKASSFDGEETSSPSPVSPVSKSQGTSLRRTRKTSASNDEPSRQRKLSTDPDGQEPRARKTSSGSRTRKVLATEKKRNRESAAEEGDDEGYDDLLSAYESEEGSKSSLR